MKIAICASEGAPYAKSGGLGDVMEALPSALARITGNEVVLFLPYYNKIKTNTAYMVERVAEIRVRLGWRQQYCGIMKLTNRNDGVQVYFLDNDYYFGGRTGAIYNIRNTPLLHIQLFSVILPQKLFVINQKHNIK